MSAIVRTLSSLLRKHYSWPSWPRESLRRYVVHNVRALQKQGKLSQSFGYTWLYVNLSEKQSHRNTIRNHTFVEGWEKNARTAMQLRPPCCVAQVKATCLFTIIWLPYSTYLYLNFHLLFEFHDKAKRTQQGDLLVHYISAPLYFAFALIHIIPLITKK